MRRRLFSSGRKSRALAEIVGTLMLILIVVSAAIALAAFVASYEQQELAKQTAIHDKDLEDIEIESVHPVVNATTGVDNYSMLSVVIESLDVQNSTISELALNGYPIVYLIATPFGGKAISVCGICAGNATVPVFPIAPYEQMTLNFSLCVWNAVGQSKCGLSVFYDLPYDHFIVLDVYTDLSNDFTRSFYAPTAVEQLGETTIYTGSGEEDMLVLNGQGSINPPNSTVVWWAWSFTPQNNLVNTTFDNSFPVLGQEILVPQSDFPTCVSPDITYDCPEYYNITLTVQDSDGLYGISSLVYNGFSS